jgi:hypothetical protein
VSANDPEDESRNPDRRGDRSGPPGHHRRLPDGPLPLDIVVPDDPRELAEDIAAYHRELHAAARSDLLGRRLFSRWERFWGSGRLVMAVLVGLILVGGAATVLAPQVDQPGSAGPLATGLSAAPGSRGGLLPDANVTMRGFSRPARSLRPAVLALVPPGCGCAAGLDAVFVAAMSYHVPMYIVGARSQFAELTAQAATIGNGTTQVVIDDERELLEAYEPIDLTLVLVHSDGVVEAVSPQPDTVQLGRDLAVLNRPGAR